VHYLMNPFMIFYQMPVRILKKTIYLPSGAIAGFFPESIASAIWVPIAPQPNKPIFFNQQY